MPVLLHLSKFFGLALALFALVPVADAATANGATGRNNPPDAASRALEPLLLGEFALQAGRLDEAARAYLDAARAGNESALAERATRIALLAKDDARAAEALALWHRLGGKPEDLHAADAMLALRQGNEAIALRHLVALLVLPGDEGWRQAVGVIGVGARDPKQAATLVRQLIDGKHLPAGELQAWLAFGGLAQRLEQPVLADRIVEEVVRRFPGEPRVALLHASQLRESGRKDEARAALAALAPQAAANAEIRVAVAAEYDRLGDRRAAAEVLAQGPQDEQTYALRASMLARDDDRVALAKLYEELGRHGSRPDPQWRLLLGQVAEFLEKNEEALIWYRSVPGGPQRWPARLRAASVIHKLGRVDEALKTLREMQADAAVPDEARRDSYLVEASLHSKGNSTAELEVFARALAAFPDDPEILYARALSWERRDDIARAEADFRRILVADPDSVAALNALGYTLADRTTRYQEALELIDRARAAEPDNAAIIDSYGWVLFRLGRHEEALTELRRAFTLQKDAEIAAHLGEVLWVTGRREEARRYFGQARELDKDNRALKRALERTGA